jgi:predicted alpha/beta superfamily hydrolase
MLNKLLFVVTLLFTSASVISTEIDQKHQITSQFLNESRDIWVSLPASYQKSKSAYPVLYVLDGQSHFTITSQLVTHLARSQRIPEMIVVGIPLIESNGLVRDRIRDLSPTHVKPGKQ